MSKGVTNFPELPAPKNLSYRLPMDKDKDVERGFVANCCQIPFLQERLRKIRLELEEKDPPKKIFC